MVKGCASIALGTCAQGQGNVGEVRVGRETCGAWVMNHDDHVYRVACHMEESRSGVEGPRDLWGVELECEVLEGGNQSTATYHRGEGEETGGTREAGSESKVEDQTGDHGHSVDHVSTESHDLVVGESEQGVCGGKRRQEEGKVWLEEGVALGESALSSLAVSLEVALPPADSNVGAFSICESLPRILHPIGGEEGGSGGRQQWREADGVSAGNGEGVVSHVIVTVWSGERRGDQGTIELWGVKQPHYRA